MESAIRTLEGPIVVLGGTGFLGGHLVRYLTKHRKDVYFGDRRQVFSLLGTVKPVTLFNCAGCGLFDVSASAGEMFYTNNLLVSRFLEAFFEARGVTFIHAGSAAEYGEALVGPKEDSVPRPQTPYGVSKAGAAGWIRYFGKFLGKRVANLRFYTLYGAYDKPSRLTSRVVELGRKGRLPEFGHPKTARDFVYVEDACRAFVLAALNLKPEHYGEAFNIGGDIRNLGEVAKYAKKIFKIKDEPVFNMLAFESMWGADGHKAEEHLGFKSEVSLFEGLKRMAKGKV